MNRFGAAALAALIFLTADLTAGEPGEWRNLFDGQSLQGWIQRGGQAKYKVEDGAIVGTTVPKTPNSFLCTEKTYGDFIFEVEYKVHPKMNSGIQIRSESYEAYNKGRVHGYQVEIDPSARAWSGGIYDEGRRGWLNDLKNNPEAGKAFKQDDWNKYRVEAIGDRIRTWINGVPAADLVDSMTIEGFIALQVHGIGSRTDEMDVRWRNIRIQDLGRRKWEPIFDGKSLAGWTPVGGGKWRVIDGVIVGTSTADEKKHGLLLTEKSYGDFTLRLKFRATEGNSGVYFRAEPVDHPVMVHGFQAEITPDKEVGGLYETGGRAWVVKTDDAALKKAKYKGGDWNDMAISAHGGRIVVHVNNTKMAELLDDPGRKSGRIGLQLHGGQDMKVEFKDIELLGPAVR